MKHEIKIIIGQCNICKKIVDGKDYSTLNEDDYSVFDHKFIIKMPNAKQPLFCNLCYKIYDLSRFDWKKQENKKWTKQHLKK